MTINRWSTLPLPGGRTLYKRIPSPLTEEQVEKLHEAEQVEDRVNLSEEAYASSRAYKEEEYEQEEKPGGIKNKGLFGIISLIALFVVKFKTFFFLLATKAKTVLVLLNMGKILTTAGTMFVTIFVYALFFGWWFAFGFVILLLIHELGHAAVIKAKGIDASAPVFIPFVGAMIAMKDKPVDAKTEAEIAYGGPAAGVLASLICYFLAQRLESELLMALAYTGFFVNLFNLTPMSPLDGGRIVTAISKKLWILGICLILGMFLLTFNILLLLILILGGIRLYDDWKNKSEEDEAYYAVSASYRLNMSLAYFALLAFSGYMTMECLSQLPKAGGL